ncbi:MAG: hypothetical protein QOE72_1507 [Chloroflexota bacterium]|jgi:hypothetical protein|nr:hypothetical protein [Chloroflexota bacterium]
MSFHAADRWVDRVAVMPPADRLGDPVGPTIPYSEAWYPLQDSNL